MRAAQLVARGTHELEVAPGFGSARGERKRLLESFDGRVDLVRRSERNPKTGRSAHGSRRMAQAKAQGWAGLSREP